MVDLDSVAASREAQASDTMSTQYNKVQGPYDAIRKHTIALIERVNVRQTVLPFIKDASVLDLACGTGFYTRPLRRWGARKVVGVDISSKMLEEARALSEGDDAVSFLEADCSKPTEYPGGPFDVVFGGWFLNYAPTGKEMVDFYRNILFNLKPGGHFVGVQPPPTNDPSGLIARERQIRPLPTATGTFWNTETGKVEEGITIHRHGDTPAGDLDFDTYHLRKEVYEAAARDAGVTGELVWSQTSVPEDFMEQPGKYGEEVNGGSKAEELETYADTPFYGLLHFTK